MYLALLHETVVGLITKVADYTGVSRRKVYESKIPMFRPQ